VYTRSESAQDLAGPETKIASGTATDLQAEKQVLRRQLVLLRAQIEPEQASTWSEAIGRQLLGSDLLAASRPDLLTNVAPKQRAAPGVGLFIAMRQEVDFQSIWHSLRTLGFRLCFPRMIRSQGRTDLEFLAIPDQDDPQKYLVQSRFGVREPTAVTPQNGLMPCDPTLILLPGLGFDHIGNRLGWGQGYYDHYLSRRLAENPTNRPILIGVAYPFQILDQIGRRSDIPVDYLLSRTDWKKFTVVSPSLLEHE